MFTRLLLPLSVLFRYSYLEEILVRNLFANFSSHENDKNRLLTNYTCYKLFDLQFTAGPINSRKLDSNARKLVPDVSDYKYIYITKSVEPSTTSVFSCSYGHTVSRNACFFICTCVLRLLCVRLQWIWAGLVYYSSSCLRLAYSAYLLYKTAISCRTSELKWQHELCTLLVCIARLFLHPSSVSHEHRVPCSLRNAHSSIFQKRPG